MSDCKCTRPITDGGPWCRACDDEMEQLAAELPAMIGYLYDALGGQVRFGGGVQVKTGNDEVGLNLPKAATETSALLKAYLRKTTRLLMDPGAAHPIHLPADELEPMARFLYGHLPAFRRLDDVYDLKEELSRLTGRIVRSINSPLERVYAGKCSVDTETGECPQELYAVRGKTWMQCPRCGFRHEVAARQEIMRQAAEDILMTAKELEAALPNLMGVPLKRATLRSWKNRGRLEAKSITYSGEDLFRTGDVLDLAVEAAARNQTRKAG